MIVQVKLESLKGIQPHEYAVRFLFGGIVCVLAGLIAKHFGATIGGLFLAFPAIFPASACMVESHEKKHKQRAGFDGTRRARTVAGVDAEGTALGCVGLAAFAFTCALGLGHHPSWVVFCLGMVVWFVTGFTLWYLRKIRLFRRPHGQPHAFRIFESP